MSSDLPSSPRLRVTVFDATRRVASGALISVVDEVSRYRARTPQAKLAMFDDATGEFVDCDWDSLSQAFPEQAAAEPAAAVEVAAPPPPRRPGRPRLGVVAREVTLLPEDWEWLGTQPGGASATLRKLIDEARQTARARERVRAAHEAAYRFVLAMAEELPGYEDALLALYAGDTGLFDVHTAGWPVDLRDYVRFLGWPA